MMKNFILLSLFFLSVTNTLSAEEEIEDYFSLSFNELMDIDITGSTLTDKKLKTVPAVVTVFSDIEIQKMGLDTLDELMHLVPGFQSYRNSNSSLEVPFSSRGRRIGNPSSEVLIVVDGQRLEEPGTAGSAQIVPKFSLKQIERVEFIRGPVSAIYGSNAMMGMINIITRSDVNEISISHGSYNRTKASIFASDQMGDISFDLFAQIDTDSGDDYRVHDPFSPNQPVKTDDPRYIADLNIKLKWQDTHLNILHNQFDVENFYEVGGIANNFNERSTELSSISLKQNFDWSSIESFFWLSYNQTKFNITAQLSAPGALDSPFLSNPQSDAPILADADFDDYSEIRTQWHNSWEINEESDLQFGLEYRHIDIPEEPSKNNFDINDLANGNFPVRYYGELLPTTIGQAKSRRDVTGLYGQYQHHLFDDTHFTMGFRYDYFSGIDSQLSPRFAVVHELNEHHSLKLIYGEAFRAPTETELNLQNNPILLGNPDLKPESVKSLDLVWIGQWSDTSVSLNYFENHFTDSIVQIDQGGGLFQYENTRQDPSKGVELEITHEFNSHWLLRGSYSYFSSQPELSFRETDRLASLMLNYQRAKWNVNLIAAYQGEREIATSTDQRVKLDQFWLTYAKLSYNFKPKWQGFIQIKNLLDEDYYTPTSGSDLTEGIPNRGQELLFGIRWQF